MDTNSSIVYVKTDDIFKDITDDLETRFDIWNYELDIPFPKVIRLMKDRLGGKLMTKFIGLRAKTYNYLIMVLITGGKRHKKFVIKKNFENYKNCLKTTQLDNKINYLQ